MTTIFFATNRDVKHETSKSAVNLGNRFNAMGPQCFRVGRAMVDLQGDPYDADDEVWKVGECVLFPEDLDSDQRSGAKLGSERLFEELRKQLKSTDRDVIVYIHGFASSFPMTLRRAAAIETLYGQKGKTAMVVAFSWPANGRVFPAYEYFSDREDAEASGLAMARALLRLVEFLQSLRKSDEAEINKARAKGEIPDADILKQCHRKIHLVAHSMGVWALRHAVRKFSELHMGRVPRVFDNAFLMAADEDEDALRLNSKLGKLTELANYVHVYHASNDIALEIADKTKGNPDRLGADGPDNLDLLSERVITVDCSKVSDTMPSHGRHQYYRLRREVVDDVVLTLTGEVQDGRKGRVAIRPGRAWRLIDRNNK